MEKYLFKWRNALASENGPAATTRHVLLTLSLHMDAYGGSCFPSTKLLAEETGLSERTVCTHLEKASKAGWIEKCIRDLNVRGWKRHKYQAMIPPPFEIDGTERGSAPNEKIVSFPVCGTEPDAQGTESDNTEALKEVQSSTSDNSKNNSSMRTESLRSSARKLFKDTPSVKQKSQEEIARETERQKREFADYCKNEGLELT